MSKVTVNLMGGVGNYLFQIASAYSYGLKHGKDPLFNPGSAMVVHNSIESYRDNILRNLKLESFNEKFTSTKEVGFHYTEIPEIEGNVCLDGYFQTEKYFKEHEVEVKELLSCPTELRESLINKFGDMKNSCSMHIRRGDYLTIQNILPVQGLPYFMKALKKMPKDCKMFVFSDDIKWCKDSFPDFGDRIVFVEGQSDYEDLYLMSMCTNNIISNSTFSWWASWLNENTEKIIVAPSVWFGQTNAHMDTKDICPDNWIRI